jgi:hypothetical protein
MYGCMYIYVYVDASSSLEIEDLEANSIESGKLIDDEMLDLETYVSPLTYIYIYICI